MNKLIISMMSESPEIRPTCTQILADRTWCITENDISYYGLDKEDIMKDDPDNIFTNYFKQKIHSSKSFDERLKVLEHIGEGGIGSVFKVKNESDQMVYSIKKIPLGISIRKSYNDLIHLINF